MLITFIHIATGTVGLISGAVAFYALKGSSIHKRSGLAFVVSMLLMSATGAVIAALNSSQLSVIAGALTFYLVLTAYLSVQRASLKIRYFNIIMLVFGGVVGLSGITIGIEGLNTPDGQIDGKPAQVAVVFGSVALIATLLDLRAIIWGSAKGKHRLLRHLWRMGFALLIATVSFFLGQSQLIPEFFRHFLILLMPVIAVIILMVYWIIRIQYFSLKQSR